MSRRIVGGIFFCLPDLIFSTEVRLMSWVGDRNAAVAVDLDLEFPLLSCRLCMAENGSEKPMFEPQASFGFSHFLTCTNGNPKGSGGAVAFFGLHFFGEAKKVSSRRSTTGQQSQINAIGQKNQQQASPPRNTHAPYRHDRPETRMNSA